MTTLNML